MANCCWTRNSAPRRQRSVRFFDQANSGREITPGHSLLNSLPASKKGLCCTGRRTDSYFLVWDWPKTTLNRFTSRNFVSSIWKTSDSWWTTTYASTSEVAEFPNKTINACKSLDAQVFIFYHDLESYNSFLLNVCSREHMPTNVSDTLSFASSGLEKFSMKFRHWLTEAWTSKIF